MSEGERDRESQRQIERETDRDRQRQIETEAESLGQTRSDKTIK